MQVGQQVNGSYLGDIGFSGRIQAMRALTVKTDGAFEYVISLEAPVSVFGEERDSLIVYAQFDGAASSYTRHTDSMVAA